MLGIFKHSVHLQYKLENAVRPKQLLPFNEKQKYWVAGDNVQEWSIILI